MDPPDQSPILHLPAITFVVQGVTVHFQGAHIAIPGDSQLAKALHK